MADETPALPWASTAAITETIEPDLPSTLQQPLSRIEVKWEIEDTDGEGNTVGTSLKVRAVELPVGGRLRARLHPPWRCQRSPPRTILTQHYFL